jgi:hypothetical protein
MQNRVFFPQEALDLWISEDRVELAGKELVLKAEGRRYRISDAIRVLREVTGSADTYEIVGRVKSVNYLTELGAELLGTSMLIGDNAYDVVPGFLAAPLGTASELREGQAALSGSNDDEELLARLLVGSME